MFGEAFDGREDLVSSYTLTDLRSPDQMERENSCVTDGLPLTGDQLDGVFHFPQYFQAIRDVFQQALSTDRIDQLWQRKEMLYGQVPTELGTGLPPAKTLVNFLDNHDVPRFLYNSDVPSLHLALTFIMTEDGIPCVYYGDEQEFSGGNDPANREDMWSSGFDTSGATFQWVRKLTRMRKAYVALRRGDIKVVWSSDRVADETDAGLFAFERAGGDAGDGYALVVLNTNKVHDSTPVFNSMPMVVSQPQGTVLVDVLGNLGSVTVGGAGTLGLTLPPLTGAVLVPQSQVVVTN
jgi:alpha-amylase